MPTVAPTIPRQHAPAPALARRRWLGAFGVLTFLITLTGCSPQSGERPPGEAMRIVVSIPALEGFMRDLAPKGAEITSLTPPGASHHGHEPTPGALGDLVQADVVALIGMGLEPQAERALEGTPRKWRRVVVFAEVAGVEGGGGGHDHGHAHGDHHGHDHAHDDHADPHLWLDPSLVERLIPALRVAVQSSLEERGLLTTEDRARLDDAERRLIAEARDVDAEFSRTITSLPTRVIVSHHNAYSRWEDRYGLEIAAVIRPIHSVEPTPGQIADAVRAIRERGARAIYIEPQFSAQAAERIAETTGVRVLTLDPQGDGDWAAMMRKNLESLAAGLGGESAPPEAPEAPESAHPAVGEGSAGS